MSKIKIDKQKVKLEDRINQLQNELNMSLQKKAAGKAIDVPTYTRKIQELKLELAQLK